jgi:hypothetical protein
VILSSITHASVTGLRWVEVDNTVVDPSSDPIAGAAWLTNPAGWRTFDLYAEGDTTTRLQGFYFGNASNPSFDDFAIYTDGAVFNHAVGGDFPRPDGPIFGLAPLLAFDTLVTIDGLDERFVQAAFSGIDLSDGVAGLRGGLGTSSGFTRPLGDDGVGWLMRLTVSADFSYLGNAGSPEGLTSIVEVFYLDEDGFIESVELLLPNVIPSPSAAGIFALAGLALTRRRR